MICKFFFELEPNQSGPPGRMEALELAGLLEEGGVARRSGPAARMIVGGEPVGSERAVEAPDLPDGVVGQSEFDGDDGELFALLMTADDLLTDGNG